MTSLLPESVVVSEASSVFDYLFLRKLRNEVRHDMTNNTDYIGVLQQLHFYLNKPSNVDIFIARIQNVRVGYLLLRLESNEWFVTEAVHRDYRRKGVASSLLAYAKENYTSLKAEILMRNEASMRLHEAAGFVFLGSYGGIASYSYTGPTK